MQLQIHTTDLICFKHLGIQIMYAYTIEYQDYLVFNYSKVQFYLISAYLFIEPYIGMITILFKKKAVALFDFLYLHYFRHQTLNLKQ